MERHSACKNLPQTFSCGWSCLPWESLWKRSRQQNKGETKCEGSMYLHKTLSRPCSVLS